MYYDVTRAMCYDWSWVFAIIIVGWIIGDLSIDHLQTIYDDNLQLVYVDIRVSEPACFGAAPALGSFYPEPAPTPGKREHNVVFF